MSTVYPKHYQRSFSSWSSTAFIAVFAYRIDMWCQRI